MCPSRETSDICEIFTWCLPDLQYTMSDMRPMQIFVLDVSVLDCLAYAHVLVVSKFNARINMELTFQVRADEDPWESAYDEALDYLDPA